jgi:hypothetical protein
MASKGGSAFFEEWLTLRSWLNWFGEKGGAEWLLLSCIYVGMLGILSIEIPNLPIFALSWTAGLAPIFLPIALFWAAYFSWANYVRADFLAHKKSVLLEIKIPRDIMKSPRAMEVVFSTFVISSGEVTFYSRVWKGSVRPWFSFELCSFGGEMHFYVWCWESNRKVVETAIYAEYPEVEIVEAEDYAAKFVYDAKKMRCFCGNIAYKGAEEFNGKAKDDAFPVKSYIDFELDKDPKEEYKIDPLSEWFETMSSLKPHEQAWYQMCIRMNSKSGVYFPRKSSWTKRVRAAVDQIRKQMTFVDAEDPTARAFPRPTWSQQEVMRILERHLGKIPFE